MANVEQLDLFDKKPLYQFRLKDFVPLEGVFNYRARNKDNPDTRCNYRDAFLVVYSMIAVLGGIPAGVVGVLTGLEKIIS